jgi:ABC-type glycerol-3-phosphate transport system permease component
MTPRSIKLKALRHHWPIYLLVLPATLLMGLFQYYPAASGAFHSLFRWNGGELSEFVGLGNYQDLLKNPEFWDSFSVAIFLGLFAMLKMIPALAVAVCIHRCRSDRAKQLYRTLFVVPMVVPALVITLIWRSFFFDPSSGYLNAFLHDTGLFDLLCRLDHWFGWGGVFAPGHEPSWLGDPRLIIAACILWGFPWVGSFAVLTHMAKLQNIGRDVYEAADLDGVNWWNKFWKIELPLIMESISLLLVLVIIDSIKEAGMILALAGMDGGPGGKATVPALFMIRKAFIDQQMGYACAVGIVLAVVVMLVQKLSGALVHWTDLPAGQRTLWRGAIVLFSAAIFYSGHLRLLAPLLLILAVPWQATGMFLKHLWPGKSPPAAPNQSASKRSGYRPRHSNAFCAPLLHRTCPFALRLARHGFIVLVLMLAFLPIYLMIVVSLKSNPQFYAAPARLTAPHHWENWKTAWVAVSPSVANSLFVCISSTAISLALALAGAYFFARVRVPASNALWNAILILMVLPTIANLVPLFRLLRQMNLLNTLTALILVGASGGLVFAIFVLRSFISDVPQEMLEAAEVDGAGHLRQLLTIVAPLSVSMLGTVGVMLFIGQWNDFLLPLIIIRDHTRLPVMVQLLRMAGEYIKFWGPLMAGYTIASIPVVVLFTLSMRLFSRGVVEGAVKG